MSKLSIEAKVGVFVVIGMIILGYMSMRIGKLGFKMDKGYDVNVYFDSASGLEEDVSVEIAGVEVGRVRKILLENGKALVILRIDSNVKLRKDVKASIRSRGILGDKYVVLVQGSTAAHLIEPDGRIISAVSTTDLDSLMNVLGEVAKNISELTRSFANVMGGEQGEASLRSIVDSMKSVAETLDRTVQENNEELIKIIANLSEFSATINEISSKINKGEGSIGRLIKEEYTVEKLNGTLTSLQKITEKINRGEGSIGKLINDEETVENIDSALTSINDYMQKQESFRTYLDYKGEYLFDSNEVKSYLTLRIQPREDKYYLLQVIDDPEGVESETDITTTTNGVTTTEHIEKNKKNEIKFSAQIAKRYYDLGLRGGIFESTGGFAFDYYLFKDRLTLSVEAFDFDSDSNAHLKFKADFTPFKHLYITSGFDDFISDEGNESFFIGAGINFLDEDIKTLLSNLPLY
ncbi:MAG: MlaD family protein [Deltaproteobacteria bacterium]|nr:MlaD family protein [Deltaproteobacteria bacterium]